MSPWAQHHAWVGSSWGSPPGPFLSTQGFTSPWKQLRKLWTHGRGDRDPGAGLGAGMGWLEALPCCPPSVSPRGNNKVMPETGLRTDMK